LRTDAIARRRFRPQQLVEWTARGDGVITRHLGEGHLFGVDPDAERFAFAPDRHRVRRPAHHRDDVARAVDRTEQHHRGAVKPAADRNDVAAEVGDDLVGTRRLVWASKQQQGRDREPSRQPTHRAQAHLPSVVME
jgi:hypothetical protein